MKLSSNAKKAVLIGVLCSISYFAVYIARNILSVVTPQLLSENVFSESFVGKISSLYFIFYAFGQLINGIIGEKIKAVYMISFGLLLAGVSNIAFSFLTGYKYVALVAYAMTGFFLAMIYGPMTKVVAENTEPVHAERCSLGYTFASFFGSPAAGALAAVFAWKGVFAVGSGALWAMAAVIFISFTALEKKGVIQYNRYKREKKQGAGVKALFEHKIVKFSCVAALTGVVRTSVVFWLPTYLTQYLGYAEKTSAGIFSAATLVISLTAFITLFIYERLKRNRDLTVLLMFSLSTVFFTALYFVKIPVLNIGLIVLAIMSSNGAATILWSVYCPSLRDTGTVSSATGFLDFLSYMAAALSNVLFADAVTGIGWKNLILVWLGIVVLGVLIALPYDKFRKRAEETGSDETTETESKEISPNEQQVS